MRILQGERSLLSSLVTGKVTKLSCTGIVSFQCDTEVVIYI